MLQKTFLVLTLSALCISACSKSEEISTGDPEKVVGQFLQAQVDKDWMVVCQLLDKRSQLAIIDTIGRSIDSSELQGCAETLSSASEEQQISFAAQTEELRIQGVSEKGTTAQVSVVRKFNQSEGSILVERSGGSWKINLIGSDLPSSST